jgi:hypothetical protein
MAETSGSITVSTKLERIAKLAREMPQAALTTLAHHIDIDWLREAYRRTRKNGCHRGEFLMLCSICFSTCSICPRIKRSIALMLF